MVFTKNFYPIGLEITNRRIKAIQFKESFAGFNFGLSSGLRLKTFGIIEIDKGIVEDGKINDVKKIADAIRSLVTAYNFKEKKTVISLSGHFLYLKNIICKNSFSKKNIYSEAKKFLPFDLESLYLDFHITDIRKKSVLIVGIKKEIADSYIEAVKKAGLIPYIIDAALISLYNLYEFNYGVKNKTEAFLSVSYDKTFINIIKKGFLLYFREIRYQKKSYIKKELCQDIKEAFDFFIYENPKESIEKIILNGKESRIAELRKNLSERYKNIEKFNIFNKIKINKRKFSPSYIEDIKANCAVCAGAGLFKTAASNIC
jgi:Tfp pilus assembly PilM family ATPase